MHIRIRRVTRAYLAAAAGIALSTAAMSGASASAAAPRAARVLSAAASHAAPSPGTQLWVKRYNGPTSSNNQANAVAVSPTGNAVFVTGETTEGGGLTSTYTTIAYDATTGAQLWAKRYSAGFATVDLAYSVAVSPDGGTVFVTGQGTPGYVTIAYNAATGAQLWLKHGPAGSQVAYSVAVSPTGSAVYVTGYSTESATGEDYATVAYDATTGAQLWVKRYSGPGTWSDRAYSMAVSPNGGTVYVTGESGVSITSYDYATVAYNAATGAQLWVKRYNGPAGTNGTDVAHSVAVSPTGNEVFVTGESYGNASNEDYATVAYNATTGAQLWAQRYGGTATNNFFQAFSVAASPTSKTVYVTGFDESQGDYATVAYNAATGAPQWAKNYRSPGGTGPAQSVAVSPTGTTVYVTGAGSWPGAGEHYATVAYNAATGAQQWAQRYNGPAGTNSGDIAYSLAVSPASGTVFVTGTSVGVRGQFFDYATVAYSG